MRWTALACAVVMIAGPASAGGDVVFRDPTPESGPAGNFVGRLIDDLFAPAPVPPPARRVVPRPARIAAPPPTAATVPPVVEPATDAPAKVAVAPPSPTTPNAGRMASPVPLPPVLAPPPTPMPTPPERVPAPPDIQTRATTAITTGGLQAPRAPSPSDINPDDQIAMLIDEAERAQARLDIIKLELAGRAYSEPRLSGQSVFDTRPQWRVLERARDALSEAELGAARAVGFEANAYINERGKLIVVAVAGTQDLRRDFLTANIWEALIRSASPQHFFFAKTYIRSVIQRYQAAGFSTECVGHSLGGGACAYAAAELGIRGIVVNPISAGRLSAPAYRLVTNYIVDGDIAKRVYEWRGNKISGDIRLVNAGREDVRQRLQERYGIIAGPILVVRELKDSVNVHSLDKALDLIAAQSGGERVR